MADFDVKLKKLQELLAVEDDCATELGRIQEDISNVKNSLTFKLDISAVIQGQLGSVYTHVGTQKKNVRQLKSGLNAVIHWYNGEETLICNAKTINLLKEAGKTTSKILLDILGQAGILGKIARGRIACAKVFIDGEGITAESVVSLLKGLTDSYEGVFDLLDFLEEYSKKTGERSLTELVGLENYKRTSLKDVKAKWLKMFQKTGKEALEDSSKNTKAIKAVKAAKTGVKCAGWLLTIAGNVVDNYEEYGGFTERAAAETATETLIDFAKDAVIAAAFLLGAAALGFGGVPAVAVGAGVVVVSAVADIICENFTGKGVTEYMSDKLLDSDLGTKLGKSISGAADTAKRTVSGWWTRMVQNGSLQFA